MIYIHLTGSPPNLDMFDYKPELVKRDGQPCPDQYTKGKRFAFTTGTPKLLGTRHKFTRHGKTGMWFSDAVPHLAEVADELCFVRSMYTDQFNHAPAELLVFTGSPRPGRPSMGAWVTYGLGTENQDLPGFIVLISSGTQPNGGKNSFGAGFLPTVYQGVQCRSKGDPVLYVSNPAGMDRELRRMTIDALRDLNQIEAQRLGHPETITRMSQYELAFRMQASVPGSDGHFPRAEAGAGGLRRDARREQPGEQHPARPAAGGKGRAVRAALRLGLGFPRHESRGGYRRRADGEVPHDGPCDRRLDQGLAAEGPAGRDAWWLSAASSAARPSARAAPPPASCWAATTIPIATRCSWQCGVKCGFSYGATDELGFSVTENKVHVHDLQATIMQLSGFRPRAPDLSLPGPRLPLDGC